ncbi:SMC-Scp complex subunit ScpB [Curtobacterium sp. MCJR17_055]|uniref:SMC-Scp complex subunit ScpB n=1 Tax=unclassified Curtobacterium TaxID=257496 RepID=UPI000D977A00|nr:MULTISPECIES: SMC-Scp complex subunit ScpB [unclassified Curtobacterium]PYY34651.1 SMC-Scp complex subunit ScpB [Curtobacterium sp. MCBD17_029]PYY57532.1 SMC-Scp complex subunit ScpB [Curtobacterium sp. MCPF17_015]PYY58188.1 SMC-Scp complex subunit ScpB [Curtobacterium sp. MCJR17_055]WIB36904.1 SMC-Scp complex subunit ScpB [Curtobacterium sp. MCJR17_043]
MTDDVHARGARARAGGSAEPGGSDEIEDARALEAELRAAAAARADAPAHAAPPVEASVDRQLEAILMIADQPQSLVALAAAVGEPVAVVRQAVDRLVADFDGVDGTVRRGFELREVGGGWRFYVRSELDAVVEQFVEAERPARLSQAALETLAVVAYKQPITRSQIAAIRAVNVDGVVRTLVARGLIEESFTDSETGAINYVTSELLLQQLGINSLDELPLISPLLEDGADGFGQTEGIPDGRV